MRRNKTWFFRNNPVVGELPDAELDWLEERVEVVKLRRKQEIWALGDSADRIFFVRSGVVKLSRSTSESRDLTLGFLTKDDMLGEDALFLGGVREISAVAYDDTVLYAISAADFQAVMSRNAGLAVRAGTLVAERRRKMERRVGDLLFKTAHARLASLFVDLTGDFGVRDSRGVIVNLKLTHREMASLIGATRETVSFAILDLRKDGLIQTESKRVIILEETALKDMASA